jgi:hypothetical protein
MWALADIKIPIKKIRCLVFHEQEHTVGAILEIECEYVANFCAGPDEQFMWFVGDEPPCFKERCGDCPLVVVEHDAT